MGSINHMTALVQIMAWRRPDDKPLSKPMMVILLTHICVTRPQLFKTGIHKRHFVTQSTALFAQKDHLSLMKKKQNNHLLKCNKISIQFLKTHSSQR